MRAVRTLSLEVSVLPKFWSRDLDEDTAFCPDAISMAKSLGGGVPMEPFG